MALFGRRIACFWSANNFIYFSVELNEDPSCLIYLEIYSVLFIFVININIYLFFFIRIWSAFLTFLNYFNEKSIFKRSRLKMHYLTVIRIFFKITAPFCILPCNAFEFYWGGERGKAGEIMFGSLRKFRFYATNRIFIITVQPFDKILILFYNSFRGFL